VTCTPTLRAPASPAGDAGESPGAAARPRRRSAVLLDRVRGDDVLAQFCRFVLVGSASSLVYALLFWGLEGLDNLVANLVAVVLSSIVANDLHRRLTFQAQERVSWLTAQWEGGGVSMVGLVATTLALGWLDRVSADAGLLVELALVGAVFATIGSLRFVALRWLFVLRNPHRA
jgi:putative flippase GtrA